MTKDKFNTKLREYARTLSPNTSERDLVSKIYKAFNDLFGINNCIQIGSYPRFTSVTPLHDLDLLYILGSWDENNHTPSVTLQNLFNQINQSYINPTSYTIKTYLQTHSVTVDFSKGSEVILSVDIVPAYSHGKNEFNQDTYKVPEVIKEKSHAKRKELYAKLQSEHRDMSWISSDPRGYIKVATDVGQNPDFRKAVKFLKRWKYNLCDADDELKLKSFHIEQVVTHFFQANRSLDIFDAIFKFFHDLPEIVDTPNQITDRANSGKYIDDYLEKFTSEQKDKIKEARDGFLIKLESFEEADHVDSLVEIDFYQRKSLREEYLFDRGIPTLKNDVITINAWIQQNGSDARRLNAVGVIDNGHFIRFEVFMPITADYYSWKVKNDDRCSEPRGEITRDHTQNNPEQTKYRGSHYVECYAIRNDICIASARQNVVLH